jgi:hypothetical protein
MFNIYKECPCPDQRHSNSLKHYATGIAMRKFLFCFMIMDYNVCAALMMNSATLFG